MTYIIFAAGIGERLRPLTLKYSKTQYKLDPQTTILQRMVRTIRKYDRDAEIVALVGYKAENIKRELEMENVKFVNNPFYAVSGSVASLWFARDYLERENVTLINGDIVVEEDIVKECICESIKYPYVVLDSSAEETGRYCVQVKGENVLVLSKELNQYHGNYCHIVKLDAVSSRLLKEEVKTMVNDDMYDQPFESALVQMIFSKGFELGYRDIAGKQWVEIEQVDDMLKARCIHTK